MPGKEQREKEDYTERSKDGNAHRKNKTMGEEE
jgi:hypothetical protein